MLDKRNAGRKHLEEVDRMGCLFALLGGLFPRLALLIVWIARPVLVGAAFNTFLLPLLGIIFLPFATLIYVIVYTPGVGLVGFDWFWVILAVLLDISHWSASYTQRNQIPGVR
jgi:hypothetical protein